MSDQPDSREASASKNLQTHLLPVKIFSLTFIPDNFPLIRVKCPGRHIVLPHTDPPPLSLDPPPTQGHHAEAHVELVCCWSDDM